MNRNDNISIITAERKYCFWGWSTVFYMVIQLFSLLFFFQVFKKAKNKQKKQSPKQKGIALWGWIKAGQFPTTTDMLQVEFDSRNAKGSQPSWRYFHSYWTAISEHFCKSWNMLSVRHSHKFSLYFLLLF